MKLYLTLVILFFIGGCEKVETLNGDSNDSFNNSAVIVSLQDSDNVAIVNAATLEIQDQINIDLVKIYMWKFDWYIKINMQESF